MTDQDDLLQMRLDQNYKDYIAQLQDKTADELIALAPEIAVAKQLQEELLSFCGDDDTAFLLRFRNPLEVVRDYWAPHVAGYDCSDEIVHMLWEIRDRELYEADQLIPEEAVPKPKMRLSAKERRLVLIAGAASNVLHGRGQHQQAGEVFQGVLDAGSYEAALRVVRKYLDVEIIPAAKRKKKSAKKEKTSHER